jgi:hypothetical protein
MKAAAKTERTRSRRAPWVMPAVAFVLAASGGAAVLAPLACGRADAGAPGPDGRVSRAPAPAACSDAIEADVALAPEGSGAPAAATAAPAATAQPLDPDAPYDGPLLGAMAFQTPIYPEPRFSDDRLGYIRQGGKVPVDSKPIKKSNCKQGWFRLVEGGYVCGKYATVDMDHPRVKLGVRQPDRAAVLPYQYAYNRYHGTPLYKTLPTREEMHKYEPYLLDKKKDEAAEGTPEGRKQGKHAPETAEGGSVPSGDMPKAEDALAAVSALETAAPAPSAEDGEATAEPPAPKPWWQTEDQKPIVSLSDLEQDADHNLSKRMVKGFFIAVDKSFGWNDRLWYRTTGGLVAPTDRMWINKPPETKGLEWPEGAKQIYFMLSDKGQKLEHDPQKSVMKDKGKLARFSPVPLTGRTLEVEGGLFHESTEGFWVKDKQGTVASPGPRPADVGADERWVDVDIEKKTLVLVAGDKPVYAALVSPGKRSRNKKKDHATPTGAFRIREKHIAVTMDGDGAAGDLPYSIEDVPYVAYFKGSYALHGAFWHNNFGREMSHGCVNLAPLDAKYVFNWVEPRVPRGWHAVFATKERPGSMVVVRGP